MAHVDHTVAEPSVVQQLEVEPDAGGQRRLAAADEHGAQEQHALVDQGLAPAQNIVPVVRQEIVDEAGLTVERFVRFEVGQA